MVLKLRESAAAAAVAAAILMTGCGGQSEPSSEVAPESAASAPLVSANPDEEAAAEADRTPGFAAKVTHADGTLEVLLTDASNAFRGDGSVDFSRAKASTSNFVRQLGKQARISRARFDARQLFDFKVTAGQVALEVNGQITSIDIAEDTNRLRVGVLPTTTPADIEQLRLRLVSRSVDAEAVEFRHEVPARPFQSSTPVGPSLAKPAFPLAGGVLVRNPSPGTPIACTLGIPAVVRGVPGFLTGSHCTDQEYRPDALFGPAVFFAEDPTAGNRRIGVEALDPLASICGNVLMDLQFALAWCRFSDAAFVRADDASSLALGRILRAGAGSQLISGAYQVRANLDYPTLNQQVSKTGSLTGTTAGRVTATCVDRFSVSGGAFLRKLCSYDLRLTAGPGDSGAPVFSVHSDGVGVTFMGLVWGGVPDPGAATGSLVFMSPLGGIKRDFRTSDIKTH